MISLSSVIPEKFMPEPIAIESFPDTLQLLLFVDRRAASDTQNREILKYLKELKRDYDFALQIITVEEKPYLAEHFKILATPTLIKINPGPKYTLAGKNIQAQLQEHWQRWQDSVLEFAQAQLHQPDDQSQKSPAQISVIDSVNHSGELIQLSDQIFALKKDNEELLEQLQFKDRVIALLAHDLRSPLTAASLALETLNNVQNYQGKYPVTPKLIEQLITQSRNQLKIMQGMITDILEAARGNCVALNIQHHKLDIAALCADILKQMRPKFNIKEHHIHTDIPGDLPLIYGDSDRLRQVIVNLLENAIKYTPQGGTIYISILHRTTQKIQMTIRDTGLGIPPENRHRIFEDHFRLKRDENQEGYGLGLALCQSIIRAHYGHIWVDSIPNQQGSCFHFTLPVYL
jgi:two-component system, OmpR family, clock-associated histidine kinase SasA